MTRPGVAAGYVDVMRGIRGKAHELIPEKDRHHDTDVGANGWRRNKGDCG